MARNKGGFVFASNFEVKLKGALDPRVVVDVKADLINKETWPYDGDTIYLYKGLVVSVASTNELYMLVNPDNVTAADYSGWKRVDASAAEQVEIVDSLDNQSEHKALSANQGYILDQKIAAISARVSSAYVAKGSVASIDQISAEGLKSGDVYNVTADFELYGKTYPAGTNIVWVQEGTESGEWDVLSGLADLSAYATNEALENVRANLAGELEGVSSTVSGNSDKLLVLEGNISDHEERISDQEEIIAGINEELVNKVEKVDGHSLVADSKIALIDTNAEDIADLKQADVALDTRLKVIESSFTGGEIDLGELTGLVSDHGTRISALERDNTTNKSSISTLQGQVSEINNLNSQQEGRLEAVEGEQVNLINSVNSINNSLITINTTLGTHSTEINNIKNSINGLAVKSVKEGEKVLAADENGQLSTSIALDSYKTDEGKTFIKLTGIDGATVSEFDASEFVWDGMVDSVAYDPTKHQMTITWNTTAGKDAVTLDMSELVDVYTAGQGLKLEGSEFLVKVDDSENNKLSVSENGLLVDITEDVKKLEDSIDSKIESALSWETL